MSDLVMICDQCGEIYTSGLDHLCYLSGSVQTRQELADEPIYDAIEKSLNGRAVITQLSDEAKRIVGGPRNKNYGMPIDNFTRIARLWTVHFQNTGRDIIVTAQDIAPLMRYLKEARLCETPDHYDSHLDLIGYALCGAEVNGVKLP